MDLKHIWKFKIARSSLKVCTSRDRRTFNFLLTYWIEVYFEKTYWIEVYFEKEENLPFVSEILFDLKIHQEADTWYYGKE